MQKLYKNEVNCQESMNINSFLQKYVIKEFSQLYLAFLEQECWCFIKEQLKRESLWTLRLECS